MASRASISLWFQVAVRNCKFVQKWGEVQHLAKHMWMVDCTQLGRNRLYTGYQTGWVTGYQNLIHIWVHDDDVMGICYRLSLPGNMYVRAQRYSTFQCQCKFPSFGGKEENSWFYTDRNPMRSNAVALWVPANGSRELTGIILLH